MGSSGTNTELTVRINNELSALILRQTLLLDGCVFACEKSCILSARNRPLEENTLIIFDNEFF